MRRPTPEFSNPRAAWDLEHPVVEENFRQLNGVLANLNNMAGALVDKVALSDRLSSLFAKEDLPCFTIPTSTPPRTDDRGLATATSSARLASPSPAHHHHSAVSHCASLPGHYQPLALQCPAVAPCAPSPYHHHLPCGQVRDNMGHAYLAAPLCDPTGCGEEASTRANYKPPSYQENEEKDDGSAVVVGRGYKVNGSKNKAKRPREEDNYKR